MINKQVDSNWVTLATYSWLQEALLLKGRLESENIECTIPEEHLASINPMATAMVVRVQVREIQLKQAQQMLKDLEQPMEASLADPEGSVSPAVEITLCPVCGSDRIKKEDAAAKNWFTALVGLVFGMPMRRHSGRMVCESCGERLGVI